MNRTILPEELRYRMYGLVLYSLSPIQKAIQFGHAVVEYSNYIEDESIRIASALVDEKMTPLLNEYRRWSRKDKTFIILNGGTSNNSSDPEKMGGLQSAHVFLWDIDKKHAMFEEPDINNTLTAICFLVDERVWDTVKYPEKRKLRDRTAGGGIDFSDPFIQSDEWDAFVGGEQNRKLRDWLRSYKLAL